MKINVIKPIVIITLMFWSCAHVPGYQYAADQFPIKISIGFGEDKAFLEQAIAIHNQGLSFTVFELVDSSDPSQIYVDHPVDDQDTENRQYYSLLVTYGSDQIEKRSIIIDPDEQAADVKACHFARLLGFILGYPFDVEETGTLMSNDISCPTTDDQAPYSTFKDWFESEYPEVYK